MARQMFQGPVDIALVIAGNPQFAARPNHPGQCVEVGGRDEATLLVAGFRPGIGKQHKHPTERGIRQRRDQRQGIIHQDANLARAGRLAGNFGEQGRHTIDEGFAADDADTRVGKALSE